MSLVTTPAPANTYNAVFAAEGANANSFNFATYFSQDTAPTNYCSKTLPAS